MENYDNIWETVFRERSKEIEAKVVQKKSSNCEHLERNEIACLNCGLVLETQPEFDNFIYEHPIENKSRSMPFHRLTKLQERISWSKEEKTEYKLKKYVREFCEQLSIYPNLIDSIAHLVNGVLEKIKEKNDGSKRSRVKDAIIINCICYICKDYDPIYLAKRANINSKYISKADRILLDINLSDIYNVSNVSRVPNASHSHVSNASNVSHASNASNVSRVRQLRNDFLTKTNTSGDFEEKLVILMEIVDDNKLLPHDSLCSTICFYYLIIQTTLVDLNTFCEHFKINASYLVKSFNKLVKVQEKINNLLVN
jgi:hypothetical protein